jgi:hypothetical protein
LEVESEEDIVIQTDNWVEPVFFWNTLACTKVARVLVAQIACSNFYYSFLEGEDDQYAIYTCVEIMMKLLAMHN